MNDYEAPKSGFHKFIQFVHMPYSLINILTTFILTLKYLQQIIDVTDKVSTYINLIFIALLVIFNVVTQVGFAFYMGFSYYSIMLYNLLIVANNVIMYALWSKAGESLALLYYAKITLVYSIVLLIIIVAYYLPRRSLFNFNVRPEKKKKEKKRKNDPWANTDKYVPEPVVKISKKDEESIANRRLAGMLVDAPVVIETPKEEADIFAGLK